MMVCVSCVRRKMLSKLAGELHKPNQQTTLLPQCVHDYLATLPARKLPGCGWAINKQLQVPTYYWHGARGGMSERQAGRAVAVKAD